MTPPHDLPNRGPDGPDEPEPSLVERTSVLALPDSELRAHDVRRALHELGRIRCARLAPLVGTTAQPGGVALRHLVPLGAVTVGSLRDAAPLRHGHVLAVGVAVLEALVALHEAGLAHGAVGADTVLVGPDGLVVLAATGAAWAGAPGDPDGPRDGDDVVATGELLRDLLGPGSAPAPLVVAAVRATDPDESMRPDAAGLLAALRRCGQTDTLLDALWRPGAAASSLPPHDLEPTPAPAAAPEGDARTPSPRGTPPRPTSGAPRRPSGGPRRPGRTRRAARPPGGVRGRGPGRGQGRLLTLALLGLVGGALLVRGVGAVASTEPASATAPVAQGSGGSSPTSRPAPPPSPRASASPSTTPGEATVDWRAVLARLDAGRTAALASGAVAGLAEWETGPAYAADAALARSVAAAGARLVGGGLVLEEVAAVRVDRTTAVLRVRDHREAYAVLTAGAREQVPTRESRWWTVTLVRDGVRWRVAEVADPLLSPAGRR